MKMCFVTSNKSKFREAEIILQKAGVELLQKEFVLYEPKLKNQEEIVLEKARQAYSIVKMPVIVDDTAMYFHAYKKFPGTRTKTMFNVIGFKGLEKMLKNKRRDAHFETLVCYTDGKDYTVFSGKWSGRILSDISKKINLDWPYNSIFVPKGFSVSLSEIPDEERARYSHRKKALLKLMRYLRKKGFGRVNAK